MWAVRQSGRQGGRHWKGLWVGAGPSNCKRPRECVDTHHALVKTWRPVILLRSLRKVLFTFRQAFCNSNWRAQLWRLLQDNTAGETTEWKDLPQTSLTIIASFFGLIFRPLCIIFEQRFADMHPPLPTTHTHTAVSGGNWKAELLLFLFYWILRSMVKFEKSYASLKPYDKEKDQTFSSHFCLVCPTTVKTKVIYWWYES